MVQKNEDISKSVNSIDFGAISPPGSGHDLSRNVVGVSCLCVIEKSLNKNRFSDAPKKSRFFGKVLSPSDLLNLGGPAGGSAPGKVLRPQASITYGL